MKKANHRVFFAIDLDPIIKTQLMSYQDNYIDLDAQPIDAANFHITLSFLGELTERKIETIIDGLSPIEQNPFELTIKDPIYLSSAKILALEIEDKRKQLQQLKDSIESNIRSITHFNIEKRDYLPHVSLFRKVEQFPDFFLPIQKNLLVDSFCLMTSVATKKSVRYEIIEQWRLNPKISIKEQLVGKD